MGTHSVASIVGVLQSHLARRDVPDLTGLPGRSIVGKSKALIAVCGVRLETGGVVPYFYPDEDYISMPPQTYYYCGLLGKRPKRYAIDALHELIHATGHRSRLARPFGLRFGDQLYQREELVAELGSALLMKDLGFKGRPILPHARYLRGWLQGTSNPVVELDMAMARANQAAGYVVAVARHNLSKREINVAPRGRWQAA